MLRFYISFFSNPYILESSNARFYFESRILQNSLDPYTLRCVEVSS